MEIANKTTSEETRRILNAANREKPDEADKKALQKLLDEKPELWQKAADLVDSVQKSILNPNIFKTFLSRESYKRKLAELRDNLGWQTASELEKILIEQVCLNWLRINLLEITHQAETYADHTTETELYWDKRLNSAQRRYLRACETLARVRKLLAEAELKECQLQATRTKIARVVSKLK